MAKKKAAHKASRKRPVSRRATASAPDAITLLKADHRQVKVWFAEFEKSRAARRKASLAEQICAALRIHTTIEEEIFYPAFLEATEEKDIHHEAEIEHNGAKALIAEIEQSSPEDDYYDAKIKVLSEMIKHHVNEEEKRDGMFSKARHSNMDLLQLGEHLAARKAELMGGSSQAGDEEGDRSEADSDQASSRGRSPGIVARHLNR